MIINYINVDKYRKAWNLLKPIITTLYVGAFVPFKKLSQLGEKGKNSVRQKSLYPTLMCSTCMKTK